MGLTFQGFGVSFDLNEHSKLDNVEKCNSIFLPVLLLKVLICFV